MAAGNQRANMRQTVRIKIQAKKRLSWDTQKALEVVPTIGGGTPHSVPIIPYADKFILMQF